MYLLILIGLLLVLWKLEPVMERQSVQRGARRAKQALRQIYAAERELVAVRPEDFPHLDLAFYDSTTRVLAQHGFRALGDLEDRTVSANSHARRTFMRTFTDDDSIQVAIYNFQLAGWARWIVRPMRNLCIVDVDSELSDGRHLSSSNAWHARHIERPPQFDTLFHPPSTAAVSLLTEHRSRLRAYREQHPDATPVVAASLEDVAESIRRSHRLKAAHRAKAEFTMSRDELRGIAADTGGSAREKAANDLADAFDAGVSEVPEASPPRPRELLWNGLLWVLLVAVFIVVYGWTAR